MAIEGLLFRGHYYLLNESERLRKMVNVGSMPSSKNGRRGLHHKQPLSDENVPENANVDTKMIEGHLFHQNIPRE